MRVLVKCPFMDAVEGLERNIGEVFDCSAERAEQLCGHGLVQPCSVQPDEQPAKKRPATRKKASEQD